MASVSTIAKEYSVDRTTINLWVRKYEADGVDGLKEARTWKKYSSELKREAVEFYLNGEGSLIMTCEKFNISSNSVLRQWINQYTSGKEIKSTSKGRETMTKGRKTTLQERIEIVQYTFANERNYHEAAKKYNVSYQQVYSSIRKYEKDGKQGLQYRRGKR
ncbi:hypothetical protein BKP57_15335 [Virgibacillus sp. 6R]|nr:hypothetical protein BKP57_15335 [Virgibacillus sp. 6R]